MDDSDLKVEERGSRETIYKLMGVTLRVYMGTLREKVKRWTLGK